MIHLKDLMASPVVTARANDSLDTVAKTMMQRKVSSVVIVDGDGRAQGIITEHDFVAHASNVPFSSYTLPKLWGQWIGPKGLDDIYAEARRIPALRVMQSKLVSVQEDESPERAVDLMVRHEVRHLPVLREGRPVGMLAYRDLMKLVQRMAVRASRKQPIWAA